MRVAMHLRPTSFSDHWLVHARELGLEVLPVDCTSPDIVSTLRSCDALLWHWTHTSATDLMMARHVIAAAECLGVHVYPSTATCWHFDDKLAQKYLLEAIGAPLVPTTCLFSRREAEAWIEQAEFPVVFKLRRGSGSSHVRLVTSRREALALARRMFGIGFSSAESPLADAAFSIARAKRGGRLWSVVKHFPSEVPRHVRARLTMPRERGYLYVQQFVPGNTHDTRVVVVGERAWAYLRKARPHDFRASGSGAFVQDPSLVDLRCIDIAFEVTRRIGAQSLAFDLVHDRDGAPRILEISYAFGTKFFAECPGHWNSHLAWRAERIRPEYAILDDLVAKAGADATRNVAAR